LAKALECAVAELTHTLAGHAEHLADFIECVLAIGLEAEVETENFCIARREREQRPLHLVRLELLEELPFGSRSIFRREPFDQRAVGVLADRSIETNIGRVQRR